MADSARSELPAEGDDLESLRVALLDSIARAGDEAAVGEIRVAALGRKGTLTEQLKALGALPPDIRKERGAALNLLKEAVTAALDARQAVVAAATLQQRLERERVDVTLDARPFPASAPSGGRVHPISQTIEEMIAYFAPLGFTVARGPDIETDWHNFTALNIPPDHPARQMQATFFMPPQGEEVRVLRTQTSPVQIRTMQAAKPPLRIIVPGRTYRCDSDMTHAPMFHQLEGLVIDDATHMGHLKGCVMDFLRAFFGIADLPIRFRPSHFPFTEPSAEVDIGCSRAGGELKLGNYGDWMEVMGCGMVHPNVLRAGGLDPDRWQGFAFGMGVERLTMLKYGIPDLRTFFDGDFRWLRHYGFAPFDTPRPQAGGGLS